MFAKLELVERKNVLSVPEVREITKLSQLLTRYEGYLTVSQDGKQIARLAQRGLAKAAESLDAGELSVKEAALAFHQLGNAVADNVFSTVASFQAVDSAITELLKNKNVQSDETVAAVAYGLAEKFLWSAIFNSEKLRDRIRYDYWGWRKLRGGVMFERMRLRVSS